MLKSRLLSLILVIVVIFSGCLTTGGGRHIKPVNSEANAPVKDLRPHHLKQAEASFQKGKELILAGDIEGAVFYFDRVINILLDTEEAAKTFNHQGYLEHYTRKISEIELSYLKDRALSSRTLEEHEPFLYQLC